ncbi:hypothetical protein Taro_015146 [Colocasia esculenta]|uniref:Dirigent protein n=1 Tax=Colocasia esculenta TaxID=4460 RepID=A0A843UKM1_COLES|nr:hypothetical protein [Colocasia esculenta]
METKGKVSPHALLMLLLLLGFSPGPLHLAAVAVSDDLLKDVGASFVYVGGLASRDLGSSPALHQPGRVSLRGQPVFEKERVRGRIDISIDDYPGSGANDRHDPRRG